VIGGLDQLFNDNGSSIKSGFDDFVKAITK